MIKKYIAISMCILAICAVFGLNARTSYEEVKIGLESVDESADTLVDDLQALQILAYVIENFNAEATTTIYGAISPETETSPEKYFILYTQASLDGNGMIDIETKTFYFENQETMGKIVNILKPLTWGKDIPQGDGVWTDMLQATKAVVFVLGVIASVLVFIVWFLLDAVLTAWEVVTMALYMLGFSITPS